jgi:hypothetical protein
MPAKDKTTKKNTNPAPVEPELVDSTQGPQLDDTAAGEPEWSQTGLTTPLGGSLFMQAVDMFNEDMVGKHIELEENLKAIAHAVDRFNEDAKAVEAHVKKEHSVLRKLWRKKFGVKL